MACTCNSAVRGGDTIIRGTGAMSVSGSGTATDPYIVAVTTNIDSLAFTVQDTATVNLQLTGSGTPVDPFVLRADTSSASQLRNLGDVAASPVATQGVVPLWIGSTGGGHFELRKPGVRYVSTADRLANGGLYQGETVRDTNTNKRFEWDGSQWIALDVAISSSDLDPSVLQSWGSIDASTDWNTLSTHAGVYRVNGVSSSNNSPGSAYGFGTLVVFYSGSSVTQQYNTHADNRQYTRTKFNAADWSGWLETANLQDIVAEFNSRQVGQTNLQNQINNRPTYTEVGNTDTALSNRISALEFTGGAGFGNNTGDWIVNRANMWVRGSMVQLDLSMQRNGQTIPAGDIPNIRLGDVTAGYGVNGFGPLSTGPGGPIISGFINGNGVYLAASTETIPNGREITLCGTWIRS